MIPEFVETEVEIVEVLTPRTSRSKLPNGCIIFTFTEEGQPPIPLQLGQKATVRLNVTDFSRGLILRAESRG